MRKLMFMVALVDSALLLGCTGGVPKPAVQPTGLPQIGWVIMSGDRDTPDRDFVCQSAPRSECVVPVSRPDEQVFTHVHFYYHPATTDVRYDGLIQIGFLQGSAAANEVKPNAVVKSGDSPANQSIVGIVTSTPGMRSLKVAVNATPTGGRPQQLHEDIPVTVR